MGRFPWLTAIGWGGTGALVFLAGFVLGASAPHPMHGGVPHPWCWCSLKSPLCSSDLVVHAEVHLGDTGWSTDSVEVFLLCGVCVIFLIVFHLYVAAFGVSWFF